jgi:DNA invertase Pin-like site-specific DNA recombinase
MNGSPHPKVGSRHLRRLAYLYVRQSTLHQVLENTESTQRQYALRERAMALGWPRERVITIDEDLGQSGALAAQRAGFQRLVAEVGLGRVGIVLGLEASRLARRSSDWHRLLEICALAGTLILDEDGLYDPAAFNDRLLLGLKGTMSEAELHVLQARLKGGILSKAARGELRLLLPVGFVYDEDGRAVLDPDGQVQGAIRLLFETFRRTGSAHRTVRVLREEGLLFPRRMRRGPRKDELLWAPLDYHNALNILHNPRYAGAYAFGRTRTYKSADGRTHVDDLPREEWHTLILEAHEGYISWEDYESNLKRLEENSRAYGSERRMSPAREGPALLQGLVLCGRCGRRMSVRYHNRKGRAIPDYLCQDVNVHHGGELCQRVPGKDLDAAIGEALVSAMTPLSLEVSLKVQDEIQQRLAEADRLRHRQVERARYEAELAQRRYLRVDPDNRLVADSLEADWNAKLEALRGAQDEYERGRKADHFVLDESQRKAILALAEDFPRLWQDPSTPDRERKRMVRLLLEDVTLLRGGESIAAHLRLKGGETRSIEVPLAPPIGDLRRTERDLVLQIDRLLDKHTDGEVAVLLNSRGLRSHEGKRFTGLMIGQLRRSHGLRSRFTRLREKGMLTVQEAAGGYGISRGKAMVWYHKGLVRAHLYNDKGECLFEPPGENPPRKGLRKRAGKQDRRVIG